MGTEYRLVEKPVCDYAEQKGLRALKLFKLRGWPDRVFIGPNKLIFFIEFKRPDDNKGPTKYQVFIKNLLNDWGFNAYITNSKEEGKKIIDEEIKQSVSAQA